VEPLNSSDYTVDELMIWTMAHYLRGEVLVSWVTAFGALAGIVAQRWHAPDLVLLASPESGLGVIPTPTLTLQQFLGQQRGGIPISMEETFDAIFRDRFRIWIQPAQIDQVGSVNISAIGSWEAPKVALVGSRGIPEDTTHLSELLYYIPEHSPRSVVATVDVVSGAGYTNRRADTVGTLGAPTVLVTNLGVFDFSGPNHTLAVVSLHPGVSLETVAERTGFPITLPSSAPTTTPPPPEVVAWIRGQDPLEVRKLEMMRGEAQAAKLAEIWERERALLASPASPLPQDR
jgi:glutaconate CoA-transferase subunit B